MGNDNNNVTRIKISRNSPFNKISLKEEENVRIKIKKEENFQLVKIQ